MESILELMKSIPATAWSALATAIVTSGIAYIGVSYTNRENMRRLTAQHEHDRRLRQDEIERERAEELYVSIKKFCSRMISDHFPYLRVMKGQFEYEKALDMTLESSEKRDYDPERIHMIADMYFPELSVHIKDIVEENGKVLDVREVFKHKYQSGITQDEEMASLYLEKIENLIISARDLEKKVISVVKNV
ncbi:hypothetical protein [Amphritea atlantica]|nr:hypothetical protein [Amphritea atlantica]